MTCTKTLAVLGFLFCCTFAVAGGNFEGTFTSKTNEPIEGLNGFCLMQSTNLLKFAVNAQGDLRVFPDSTIAILPAEGEKVCKDEELLKELAAGSEQIINEMYGKEVAQMEKDGLAVSQEGGQLSFGYSLGEGLDKMAASYTCIQDGKSLICKEKSLLLGQEETNEVTYTLVE